MASTLFTFLGVFIIIVGWLRETQSNKIGYYAVVAPGTIRSESIFHISITLNDFHQSCWFNISLTNFNQTSKLFEYEGIEVLPKSTKLIKLRAPYLTDKLGNLEVFGYRGITSRESAVINFEAQSYSTFIQINKAKFKPGELIEFRVICIDQLTRPAKDGQDNLLKIIDDVKLVQGVFRSEYQISENPVLGDWLIKVEINGDVDAEKSFEVARYTLPKFAVQIQTNSNVAFEEGVITLEISSSYFYGEPVEGTLTISLENIYSYNENYLPILPTKKFQIHGNPTIILDMKKDLHLKNKIKNNQSVILYKFRIKAFVIDQFSEKKSQTETEIAVYSQPYKIIVKGLDAFIPDEILIFKIKVSITDLQDNPIEDTQHPIKIFVQCISSSRVDQNPLSLEYVYKIEKDDYALINITNHNFTACYLHAEYRGIKSSESRIKKNYNSLFLEVLTESPEIGKELKIKVKSLEPIENFAYEIVSRGDIIKSELIEMPKNQTSYILSLNVTFLMVPKITIYVHGIKKRNFIGQLKDIYIKRTFKNSIQITTDEETKPNSLVNINVTTDKGSYVGLMALDYRILQNLHKVDDLTEDYFYTKLRDYDSLSFAQYYSGAKAGLVTFTNAQKDTRIFSGWGWDDEAPITGDSGTGFFQLPAQFGKPFLEFPYIRKLFSESWLYKDFERTPSGGLNFMENTPDSITTWAITGFSLNPNTGLTLTKDPTNLKVFQEFFISMDLPSLVKEGEIIEVSVYLRNHINQEAWTNVTIESEKEGLEFFEHPEEKSKEIISRRINSKKSEKITFFLRPLQQGQYNVICKAISLKASDAIQKTLNVQSQGIPYAMSKTFLVNLPQEGIQEDEITIGIPENAVPDSQRIEISIVGDVFRPLLKNLQKLARVPYGNGEDNMKYIVSNLLVLKYLKALNYSKPNLEGKLRLNLELGYQNQLSFKHLDGSFGLFERKTGERTGSVWQTAFALWGLKQASDFIHIDIRIIKRGLKYLKSKQLGNGCFESRNGQEEDVKVAAFGLMVFLMDDHSKTGFSGVISRGLQCLSDQTNASINSPSFLMSTFALLLSNHEKAENCLRKLTNRSHLAENRKENVLD
ncbi:thioester-containing protein 1 allele S3-like [Episyrphus balteatus]|uniref:thioester-containing protein 1 allele S3-like n=1 Tax=Episyrphus balteatus TaxID=286459 RepID=UPI002485F0F8|nr:thioester-containing protein 1 allele S3-like [Episyrphus balteatus]